MKFKFEDHQVNQRYSSYIQPLNQNVFEILNSHAQNSGLTLEGKKILDFGCNVGHLLTTSRGRINPHQYTGLDLNQDALQQAKTIHPQAKWIHHNAYNYTFNPNGIRNLPMPLNEKYDVIVCHGVFTHYFMKDICDTIEYLLPYVQKNGALLFSIWEDVDYYGYLGFLDRQLGINVALPKPSRFDKGFVLINRNRLLVDIDAPDADSYDWVESFYKSEYILKMIPNSQRTRGLPSKHPIYIIKT